MLRHLGLHCLNGRILSRCRPSIMPLQSIHHVPSSGRRQEPSESPPPATARDPAAGWVMLNSYGVIRTADSSVADPNTTADSCTSTGRNLRVSFGRAPPPASSFVYYDFPDTAPSEDDDEWLIDVLAAHGDSVVLGMRHWDSRRSGFEDNHFLYRAGGATRSPSLALLPERDFLTKLEQAFAPYIHPPIRPTLSGGTTGLLRRGGVDDEDALLVQLHFKYDRGLERYMAEFCLLRLGMRQWELMEPVPIVHDEGERGDELLKQSGGTDTAIPLGDRFLCLVGYDSGFFLCDMADEANPKVRFVPLPPDMGGCRDDSDDDDRKFSKNMGAAGSNAVRLVTVDAHCCCGGPGRSTCVHSRYAFTINSWTMKNLGMEEPLTWVKDSEIDCEELWALSGYEGLPRANLQCPVVSLDNPNVVCFLVSNYDFVSYKDCMAWMIQLNIRTKTLLSVVQVNKDPWREYYHLPAKLQG